MKVFANPVLSDEEGIDRGDPFVLKHLDTYYLYHTANDGNDPVAIYSSKDLVQWEYVGPAFEQPGRGHWAETDFWAPEVLYHHGTFYMYLSGTKFLPDSDQGDPLSRRLGIARSQDPTGPFIFDEEPLIDDVRSIDGHPFTDGDGQYWMIYNVGYALSTDPPVMSPETGNVIDRMITPDQLAHEPTAVSFPTVEWETNQHGDFFCNEGAWMMKQRRGRYYLIFSGGHYLDDTYGIGIITANRPQGPWHKDPGNPLFKASPHITGPGHPSVAYAPDGVTPYLVYHGYIPDHAGRKVHIDRIIWAGDRPAIGAHPGSPTEETQLYPPVATHDPDVDVWNLDFWAQGDTCRIGPVEVPLPSPAFHHIRVMQNYTQCSIRIEDILVYEGPRLYTTDIHADDVRHIALSSFLDDAEEYYLPPQSSRSWAWGGSKPAEVTLAVRGTCTIEFGSVTKTISHYDDYHGLVHLVSLTGADELRITAGDRIANVADVSIVSRSLHPEPTL